MYLCIGLAQACAIVPGVSRSGITIAVARARGIERAAAARFSFLLGSPIILGAAVFKLRHIADTPAILGGPFLAGIATAAVVGALSIGVLLRYLRHAGLGIFVAYRLLLAALIGHDAAAGLALAVSVTSFGCAIIQRGMGLRAGRGPPSKPIPHQSTVSDIIAHSSIDLDPK